MNYREINETIDEKVDKLQGTIYPYQIEELKELIQKLPTK